MKVCLWHDTCSKLRALITWKTLKDGRCVNGCRCLHQDERSTTASRTSSERLWMLRVTTCTRRRFVKWLNVCSVSRVLCMHVYKCIYYVCTCKVDLYKNSVTSRAPIDRPISRESSASPDLVGDRAAHPVCDH